ncbi:hypothetical protein [Caudoviricetes sp.]|nr:hypothetical protein [Caudoviricetes sp.]
MRFVDLRINTLFGAIYRISAMADLRQQSTLHPNALCQFNPRCHLFSFLWPYYLARLAVIPLYC